MFLKKSVISVICFLIFLMLNACENEVSRKSSYVERGKAYLEENNLQKARLEFKNVLQIDPKYADAYYYMGKIEEKEKNWNSAFSNYSKAIELNPEHLKARERVGRFYLLTDDIENSTEQVREMYSRDPNSIEAKNLQASILYKKGDLDGAIKEMNEVLIADPTRWESSVYLSRLYRKKKNNEKAEQVLKNAIVNMDENIQVRVELAYLYADKRMFKEASSVLNEVIIIDPEDIEHRLVLIAFYISNDLMDEAEIAIENTIKKFPENEKAYMLLTRYLVDNNNEDKAVEELLTGIEKSPDKFGLYLSLADVHKRLKETDKAIKIYRKIIKLDGTRSAALNARARLAHELIQQGNKKEALKLIEVVLKENSNHYEALLFQGKLALLENDFVGAVNIFRPMVKDRPKDSELAVLLAESHIRNGYPWLAKDLLRKSVVTTSGNWRVALALLRTIEKLNGKINALNETVKYFGEYPEILDIIVYKAELEAETGKDAFKTIVVIKERYPDYEIGYKMLGNYYLSKNEFDKALIEFRHNNDQFSKSNGIINGIVMTYVTQKKYDDAENYIKNNIPDIDNNLFAQSLIADISLSKKDEVAAINALKRMKSIKPEWIKPYSGLIKIYVDNGKMNLAVDLLKEGIEIAPKNSDFDFLLANVYERMGDTANLINVLKNSIKKQGASQGGLKSRIRLSKLFLKQQKLDEAKELVYAVLLWAPTNLEALFLKGQIAIIEADGQMAVDVFKDLIVNKYREIESYKLLSKGYQIIGRNTLALESLAQSVENNPENIEARFNYALLLHEVDKNIKALSEIDKALKISPDNISGLKLKVGILISLNKNADLKETLTNLKIKYKDDSFGYYFMGKMYLTEKKFSNAISEFNEALRLSPNQLEAFIGILDVHIELKQYDAAIAKVKDHFPKTADNPVYYKMMGDVYIASGDLVKAEINFKKAIDIKPDWSAPYIKIATIYINKNDNNSAIEWLNKGLEFSGQKVSLYTHLANVYKDAKMEKDVKRVYESIILEYSNNIKLMDMATNNLVAILTAEGDEKSVLKAVVLARRFEHSDNPNFLDTLGWALYISGRKDEAISILKKAILLEPENSMFQYHLGLSYYKTEKYVLAQTHLSSALDIGLELSKVDNTKKMIESAASLAN